MIPASRAAGRWEPGSLRFGPQTARACGRDDRENLWAEGVSYSQKIGRKSLGDKAARRADREGAAVRSGGGR